MTSCKKKGRGEPQSKCSRGAPSLLSLTYPCRVMQVQELTGYYLILGHQPVITGFRIVPELSLGKICRHP